jgi:hypothetical protein
MADDSERLVVLLEARIRDFEKNMQKASGTATSSYAKMRAGSKSATAAMEADMIRSSQRISAALNSTRTTLLKFAGGIGLGVGLTQIVSSARNAVKSLGDLADAAALAGASAEKLQVLRQALAQNGGEAETADAALRKLNVSLGQIATGAGGPAANAVKALGISFASIAALSPDEKFDVIAKKLAGVEDPAQRAALAAEIFGKQAGPQMAALLGQGNDVLAQTEERMRSLGTLMSNETVAAGDALDDKFQEWSTVIDSTFKKAVVGAADAVYDLIDSFRALENQSSLRNLSAELDTIAAKRDALNNEIIAIQESNPAGAILGPGKALVESQLADLKAQIAALDQEASAVLNRIGELNSQAKATRPAPTVSTIVDTTAYQSGPSSADREAKRQQDAIDGVIQSLANQEAQLGRTAREQSIYNELNRAGVSATSTYGQVIAQAAGQLYDMEEAQRRWSQTIESAQDLTKGFFSDLRSGLSDGKSFTDSLSDSLGNLKDRLLDMAMNKAIEGLFSSIFGGGGMLGGGGGILGSLLGGLFGGGGGGGIGLALGALFHEGRGPGEFGAARLVNASAFNGALRHHAGIGPGEHAAIIKNDESVLTPAQMRAAGGEAKVQVVINNAPAGTTTRESRTAGGGVRIDVMIADVVAGQIGTGESKVNRAIEQRYGLRPQI